MARDGGFTMNKRRNALLVVLAVLGGLLTVTTGLQANHGSATLQVSPEIRRTPAGGAGTGATVTATISSAAGAGGVQIDFELVEETGSPVGTYGYTPTANAPGGLTPDNADTPTTPDFSCNIPQGATTCTTGAITGNTVGSHVLITGWIDHDGTNALVDSDGAEGRLADVSVLGLPLTGTDCTANDGTRACLLYTSPSPRD